MLVPTRRCGGGTALEKKQCNKKWQKISKNKAEGRLDTQKSKT